MGPALRPSTPRIAHPPWGRLPARLRVLFVTSAQRTGSWLAAALENDRAVSLELDEVTGGTAALARLREETFDAILVSHEPDDLDALEFVEGLRGSGIDEAALILGAASEQELAPLAFEVGADGYVCVHTATTRLLVWQLARGVERHRLLREHQRLAQAEKQRLQADHLEAERLLEEQRALVRDLETLDPAGGASSGATSLAARVASAGDWELPEPLVAHYREMLRTYVIMGAGNLGDELHALAELLSVADVSAGQALQLHVRVLEDLVAGLGTRSARHVITRADLLVLELLMHVAEAYRRRWHEERFPPRQLTLPGFDA